MLVNIPISSFKLVVAFAFSCNAGCKTDKITLLHWIKEKSPVNRSWTTGMLWWWFIWFFYAESYRMPSFYRNACKGWLLYLIKAKAFDHKFLFWFKELKSPLKFSNYLKSRRISSHKFVSNSSLSDSKGRFNIMEWRRGSSFFKKSNFSLSSSWIV